MKQRRGELPPADHDKTGAMILGLWGGIVCGVQSGYSRKQIRKILDVVFDEFERKYPDGQPAGKEGE